MSPRSKREVLEAIIVRYRKAARTVKSAILNEFCEACGYHRKHALRLLNTFQRFNRPRKRQRGRAPAPGGQFRLAVPRGLW
jgi:hypothetical protein